MMSASVRAEESHLHLGVPCCKLSGAHAESCFLSNWRETICSSTADLKPADMSDPDPGRVLTSSLFSAEAADKSGDHVQGLVSC